LHIKEARSSSAFSGALIVFFTFIIKEGLREKWKETAEGADYFVTRNCGLLFSVPDGITTDTVPVVAAGGPRL
jgi:hypothetical protein